MVLLHPGAITPEATSTEMRPGALVLICLFVVRGFFFFFLKAGKRKRKSERERGLLFLVRRGRTTRSVGHRFRSGIDKKKQLPLLRALSLSSFKLLLLVLLLDRAYLERQVALCIGIVQVEPSALLTGGNSSGRGRGR